MKPSISGESQEMIFRDRKAAGIYLATFLAKYKNTKSVVLGIPRGGVPVAAEVAKKLNADLDILVARKLGAPINEELALGAVTANGGQYVDWDLIEEFGLTRDELQKIISTTMEKAREREQHLRAGKASTPLKDRTVILIDDGLATGATMRAAARSVRQAQPARMVIAEPLGSIPACNALLAEADEIVCPNRPEYFYAVGNYYENFDPVEDDEVIEMLHQYNAR